MELKLQVYNLFLNRFKKLLIVPYGIETATYKLTVNSIEVLLIVPYGIETTLSFFNFLSSLLLIVPYGIETRPTSLRLMLLSRF